MPKGFGFAGWTLAATIASVFTLLGMAGPALAGRQVWVRLKVVATSSDGDKTVSNRWTAVRLKKKR